MTILDRPMILIRVHPYRVERHQKPDFRRGVVWDVGPAHNCAAHQLQDVGVVQALVVFDFFGCLRNKSINYILEKPGIKAKQAKKITQRIFAPKGRLSLGFYNLRKHLFRWELNTAAI